MQKNTKIVILSVLMVVIAVGVFMYASPTGLQGKLGGGDCPPPGEKITSMVTSMVPSNVTSEVNSEVTSVVTSEVSSNVTSEVSSNVTSKVNSEVTSAVIGCNKRGG